MGRRRSAKPRKARQKAVKVQYVPRPDKPKKDDLVDPYKYVDALVKDTHDDLTGAKIAVAWLHDQKPDRDGHLILGRAKKATDLDREFREFDVVILLNASAWKTLDAKQRLALVDHELCHIAVATDKNDEPLLDERGRRCYRMRKHDVEEFHGVVSRHGLYLDDVAKFVRTATEAPLFGQQEHSDGK